MKCSGEVEQGSGASTAKVHGAVQRCGEVHRAVQCSGVVRCTTIVQCSGVEGGDGKVVECITTGIKVPHYTTLGQA